VSKRISIGLLAWNEEESIGATLDSLFGQSLFLDPEWYIEVVCVPNACTDGTVAAIRRAYERAAVRHPRVAMEIHELVQPGKVNAWNHFVRLYSDPTAGILVLVDADILFHGVDTLRNMVRLLEENPDVVVATDRPVKHVELAERKTVMDRISLAVSRMTRLAPGQLTGQLYAARGDFLRRLVIPEGILVEDGFLKQMVVTDCFTRPADQTRIRCAPDAAHVFEAYTRIGDILPNQRRQAVGHVVVSGDRALLDELPAGARDASQIPLHEATRLLFNRGSSLYFAGHALRFQTERAQGTYVERVQSKLKLALADAVLTAHGGYDRSCVVRRERARVLAGDLPPDWPGILALHAEGVEFKLHPRHRGGNLAESQDALRRIWVDTWLWLERRRLGVAWDRLEDYATWRGDLLPGESPWRCVLLHVRDRLKYRECLPDWRRPPRTCLMRALAAFHGARGDLAAAALGVPADPQVLHDTYRRWWLRYN